MRSRRGKKKSAGEGGGDSSSPKCSLEKRKKGGGLRFCDLKGGEGKRGKVSVYILLIFQRGGGRASYKKWVCEIKKKRMRPMIPPFLYYLKEKGKEGGRHHSLIPLLSGKGQGRSQPGTPKRGKSLRKRRRPTTIGQRENGPKHFCPGEGTREAYQKET